MKYLSLTILLLSAFALAEPACNNQEGRQPACANPAAFLQDLVEHVNAHRHETISKILPHLGFHTGLALGAHNSHSLQPSDHPDNPRLYLVTECGSLTINLYGKTIEMGVIKQKPQQAIGGNGAFLSREGEILIDFNRLPREKAYSLDDIINHLDPRFTTAKPTDDDRFRVTSDGKKVAHDSHACSSCHVDAGRDDATGTSLGQLRVGDVTAIVSPYEREPGKQSDSTPYYCLSDLKALYACRCENKTALCKAFQEDGKLPVRKPAAIAEGCARLKFALDLQPTPHCDFVPERCLTLPD